MLLYLNRDILECKLSTRLITIIICTYLNRNIPEHNIYFPSRQRQKTNYYNTKDFHL